LFTAVATGRAPVRIRGANPPVQVVHIDDAAAALELTTTLDLDGAYNVAADGWLAYEEARAMVPGGPVPALTEGLATRVLTVGWATGLGDAPPSLVPYLMHPWVVANDRLKSAGWKPTHSNEEALLLGTGAHDRSLVPWLAGAGAVTAGVALGTWWLTRRRGRG
jgi:nucleoside-diphosphate-sugar epimerase